MLALSLLVVAAIATGKQDKVEVEEILDVVEQRPSILKVLTDQQPIDADIDPEAIIFIQYEDRQHENYEAYT